MVIYANGAFGGLGPQSDFRFDFYQEFASPPDDDIRKLLDAAGKLSETESAVTGEAKFIRESQVGLILTLDKAEMIAKWMLKRIEEYKKLMETQEPKQQ